LLTYLLAHTTTLHPLLQKYKLLETRADRFRDNIHSKQILELISDSVFSIKHMHIVFRCSDMQRQHTKLKHIFANVFFLNLHVT